MLGTIGQNNLTIVMKEKEIASSDLKAHLASILNSVAKRRERFVICKHGKPVARLVPVDEEQPSLFGALEGCIAISGDIVGPIDVDWEAAK